MELKVDEPNEAQVKAALMQVDPALVGTAVIVEAMKKPARGFVLCDMAASASGKTQPNPFVHALYTALAFCSTDTRDEWCVLGAISLVYMRLLPEFKQIEPQVCEHLVYIGQLRTVRVYVERRDVLQLIGSTDAFAAGAGDMVAKGEIRNSYICGGPNYLSMTERAPVAAQRGIPVGLQP